MVAPSAAFGDAFTVGTAADGAAITAPLQTAARAATVAERRVILPPMASPFPSPPKDTPDAPPRFSAPGAASRTIDRPYDRSLPYDQDPAERIRDLVAGGQVTEKTMQPFGCESRRLGRQAACYRLLNCGALRALCRPAFLRSTWRASRVRNPWRLSSTR